MDSTASIAGLLVRIQQDNLGIDYVERRAGLIASVTAADIRHVAGRLLDPIALTITIIGDPQGLPNRAAN
jgi:zinc protease